MRQHRAVLLCVIGLFLWSLAASAADFMKSSSEPPPSSVPLAQAQEETERSPSGPIPPLASSPTVEEQKEEPSAGEIQERAVPILPRPGLSGPLQSAPPPLYVGPTQNLTKVANALQVKAKSLTIQVTVAPGLALTQPVTINTEYIGSGGVWHDLPQSYVASTGNRFVRNFPEGNGQPRPMQVNITLTEPNPGGGLYSYALPGSLTLDPLYAVRIDPLQFRLVKECACPLSSHTDIYFYWLVPDQKDYTRQRELHFYLGGPEVAGSQAGPAKMTNTIFEFGWISSEVSRSANLHMPLIAWKVPACIGGPGFGLALNDSPQEARLLPGQTHMVTFSLEAVGGDTNYQGCYADLQYMITYTLRTYSSL